MATTHYVWDPVNDSLLMEKDGAGNTLASYTNEPVHYGNLVSQRRSGATSYYHFDALGSTRLLTDSSESITDSAIYNSSGETVASSGSTTNPFGFGGALGYYANPETGDHYVRARTYRPAIARWLSIDPLGVMAGINLYVYVDNQFIHLLDPSGLQAVLPPGLSICKPEECDACVKQAESGKGMGGDEIVNYLNFLLEKAAKKSKSCTYDMNCCAPGSKDKRCELCEAPFSTARGALLPEDINKDYAGKSQIVLCSKAFTIFGKGAMPPFDKATKCQDVIETIRQELIHLLDRCTGLDRRADKCEECICDEVRGHYYSKQCEPGSIWWIIKGGRDKPFTSVYDCVTWSAALACAAACKSLSADDLLPKVKAVYGTCKPDDTQKEPKLPVEK